MKIYDAKTTTPARVIEGDCLSVMRALVVPSQRFKLVFADPPFNWDVAYDGMRDDRPRIDYLNWTREWVRAAVDLLTPDGSIVVNIPDDSVVHIHQTLTNLGLTMQKWIVWHYRFGQNTSSNFISSHVHVLYFSRDRRCFTRNMHAVLEESDRVKYGDSRTQTKKEGVPGKRAPLDVWYGEGFCRVQGNNRERWKPIIDGQELKHHNQLPERYLRRVICAMTNPGDAVLDPFCGSGTTATIAASLGRPVVTIDQSALYCRSAIMRIEKGPATPAEWR